MKDLRVDSSRNHLNEVATNRLCMDINRVLKKNTVSPLTFVIVTTKPIESIAKNLKMLLHKNNIVYRIQYTLSNKDINNQPGHIMYIMVTNPRADLKLPKKYIYYQVEQSNSNVLQSNTTNLNNSEIVWDYSIKNYENYKSRDNLKSIFYMPMPFFFEDTTNIIYDDYDSYDIYFYGSEIERRRNILNQMQKKYSNLKIGYGISGKERDNCIKSSKIVINLHYYETAALETARFNEVLQYNKLVISETSLHENDYYNRNIYKEFVEFVDVVEQDIGGLCRLIDMYLNNDELYHKKINYIKENKYKLMDLSEYFLKRNLLQLYKPDKIEINYALSSNKIYCLHLPETPERYHSFIQQPNLIDKHNIEFYPAIKYSPGWKGCAFSYVNLIYNAKRCNLKQITICEDDCCFNHDFNSKYNIILEFLQKLKQWDMFVGVVAALPEDTILHNIYRYKGMTFIEIDKMHSTVFNIYNHSCYDKILEFDINTESVTNEIIHKWFPLTVCKITETNELETIHEKNMPYLLFSANGSSAGFRYKNELWFVVQYTFTPKDKPTYCLNGVIVLDTNYNCKWYSFPFKFSSKYMEHCLGIIVDEQNILFTHSENDTQSQISLVDKEIFVRDYKITP